MEESASTEDSGIPSWVWWVLAAAVLAGVLALILVPRSRRRAWAANLARAEGEAAWMARELLPELQQAGSPAAVAGGWRVASGRVTAVEDQLTVLETSAPDEAARLRAVGLRDAVRSTRVGLDGVAAAPDPVTLPATLDSLRMRLETALGPPPASPGAAGGASTVD